MYNTMKTICTNRIELPKTFGFLYPFNFANRCARRIRRIPTLNVTGEGGVCTCISYSHSINIIKTHVWNQNNFVLTKVATETRGSDDEDEVNRGCNSSGTAALFIPGAAKTGQNFKLTSGHSGTERLFTRREFSGNAAKRSLIMHRAHGLCREIISQNDRR